LRRGIRHCAVAVATGGGVAMSGLDEILFERAGAHARKRRPLEPKVTVVMPALNEAENLPLVLGRLDREVHEVLLVDGASEDNTSEIARALHPRIRTLSQRDSGKGEALRIGFTAATGDIIVMLDADGSADPAEIPAFVGALCAGADFAKGSRFLQGAGTEDMPFYRKLGNSCFVALVRLLFGGRYSDLCYGYNAFWRDLVGVLELPDIDLPVASGEMVWGDGFEIETVVNCRFAAAQVSITEVPSVERSRIHGESNLRAFSDGTRVLRTILAERRRMRRNRPSGAVTSLEGARNYLHPRTDLIEATPILDADAASIDGQLAERSLA
jgi:glycosyltransferase involved in cell wall biosynthesis